MTQEAGQSTNLQFQGFERPSDEVLELTIRFGCVPMPQAYWTVLRQANPTTIQVVSLLLKRILLSRELEREFTVDNIDVAQAIDAKAETIRVAVREAVSRGYLKSVVKGVREKPARYAINWKETTAAAEK